MYLCVYLYAKKHNESLARAVICLLLLATIVHIGRLFETVSIIVFHSNKETAYLNYVLVVYILLKEKQETSRIKS